MLAAPTVTGSNVIDAEPDASTASGCVCTGRPPISSDNWPPVSDRMLRLTTTAVTATRSWFENVDRANDTAVTDTFGASSLPPIVTGVTVAPAGSRAPSSPRQPPRWKSLISTTSRRGSGDSARMLPATLSAGA